MIFLSIFSIFFSRVLIIVQVFQPYIRTDVITLFYIEIFQDFNSFEWIESSFCAASYFLVYFWSLVIYWSYYGAEVNYKYILIAEWVLIYIKTKFSLLIRSYIIQIYRMNYSFIEEFIATNSLLLEQSVLGLSHYLIMV